MTGELLLEIGTEEIPSDYLENGLKELKRLAESRLGDERIVVGEGLEVHGTPRRLVLIGRAVADKQESMVRRLSGPLEGPPLTGKAIRQRQLSALLTSRVSQWTSSSSWRRQEASM